MRNQITRMRIIPILVLAVLLGCLNDSFSAAYIKFDGIEGESLDVNHKGWSGIQWIQQSMRHGNDFVLMASVLHEDFTFRKNLDKASPKLTKACLQGYIFPKAVIEFSSHFENPLIWERLTFENVIITSSAKKLDNEGVKEQFTFSYEKVHWRYVPIAGDGTASPEIAFGWDAVLNMPYEPVAALPTPTPTPGDSKPTPTPVIPTPTPSIIPGDGEDEPLILRDDLLLLANTDFKQSAVIVKGLRLDPIIPGMQDFLAGQFHPMASLPNGYVVTTVRKRNLIGSSDSREGGNGDTAVLVVITPKGTLHPVAEVKTPMLYYDDMLVANVQASVVNISYSKNDQLHVMILLSAIQPAGISTINVMSLVTIEGSFDKSPVENFSLY